MELLPVLLLGVFVVIAVLVLRFGVSRDRPQRRDDRQD